MSGTVFERHRHFKKIDLIKDKKGKRNRIQNLGGMEQIYVVEKESARDGVLVGGNQTLF